MTLAAPGTPGYIDDRDECVCTGCSNRIQDDPDACEYAAWEWSDFTGDSCENFRDIRDDYDDDYEEEIEQDSIEYELLSEPGVTFYDYGD